MSTDNTRSPRLYIATRSTIIYIHKLIAFYTIEIKFQQPSSILAIHYNNTTRHFSLTYTATPQKPSRAPSTSFVALCDHAIVTITDTGSILSRFPLNYNPAAFALFPEPPL